MQIPFAAFTEIVAFWIVVVCTTLNDAILPFPVKAKPMEALLLAQVKVAKGSGLLKVIAEIFPLEHTVGLVTAFVTGVGQVDAEQFQVPGFAQ